MGKRRWSEAMAVAWRTAGSTRDGADALSLVLCSPPSFFVCATSLRARRCSVPGARGGTTWRTESDGAAGDVEEGRSGQQSTRDDTDMLSLVRLLSNPILCPRKEPPGSELLSLEGAGKDGEVDVVVTSGGRVEDGQQSTRDDADAPFLMCLLLAPSLRVRNECASSSHLY